MFNALEKIVRLVLRPTTVLLNDERRIRRQDRMSAVRCPGVSLADAAVERAVSIFAACRPRRFAQRRRLL